MKKLQAPVVALLLLIGVSSCKKELSETSTPEFQETESAVINSEAADLKETGWQTANDWKSVEQASYSVYHTNFENNSVTADAADKGLVRVFKSDKQGNPISLPFEETNGSQKLYWYYQVTEGNIMIAVDVYGTKSNPVSSAQFKSIVINPETINSFETRGLNKADLMNLSYEELTSK